MEDLKLVEVVVDQVGTPANDGTPGSALYEVPIRLSRQPTSRESELLRLTWNRPPSFTTMHRPGILTVRGDSVVLNGTTLDEVQQYHAQTLKLVVREVNTKEASLRQVDEAEAQRRKEAAETHRRTVEEASKRITFDD